MSYQTQRWHEVVILNWPPLRKAGSRVAGNLVDRASGTTPLPNQKIQILQFSRFTFLLICEIGLGMRIMKLNKLDARSAGLAGLFLAALSAGRVDATPAQFVIDSTQSRITVTGNVLGNALTEQGPGSLSSTFSGTINADISGSGIQFTGGSSLTANTNGVWAPGPGGGAGTAPADYAGQAVTLIGTLKGALRNVLLDVTSSSLSITNGQFDASSLIFAFPTNSNSTFDYDAGFLGHDGLAMTGLATNKIGSAGLLSGASGTQTLTIQTDTQFQFTKVSGSIRLTGMLVAKQAVTPAQLTISSIQVQGQTVTLHVQGALPTALVQVSTNVPAAQPWKPQPATRTDDSNGAVFTFPTSGPRAFYEIAQ
jgi:hypothetical protein